MNMTIFKLLLSFIYLGNLLDWPSLLPEPRFKFPAILV